LEIPLGCCLAIPAESQTYQGKIGNPLSKVIRPASGGKEAGIRDYLLRSSQKYGFCDLLGARVESLPCLSRMSRILVAAPQKNGRPRTRDLSCGKFLDAPTPPL
jgi:hypothetical protein